MDIAFLVGIEEYGAKQMEDIVQNAEGKLPIDNIKFILLFVIISLVILISIGFIVGYFYVRAEYLEYLKGCVRF